MIQVIPPAIQLIAECLNARLPTNVAERVLDWQGVVPTSVPLRNAIQGVACVQTSISFRRPAQTTGDQQRPLETS